MNAEAGVSPFKPGPPSDLHRDLLLTPPPKKNLLHAAFSAAGGECIAAPWTPGTSTPARLDAGGPCSLTPKLVLLRDVLGGLYASMPLLRLRGQSMTFQNLQQPVQHLCGHTVTVQHLQQIKHLYPDAFTWQALQAPTGAQGAKDKRAALLLGPTPVSDRVSTPSGLGGTHHVRQLERFLAEFADQHTDKAGAVADVPLAELPSGCVLVHPSASTPSKGILASAPPATPQTSGGMVAANLLSPMVGTPAPSAARPTPSGYAAGLLSPVGRLPPRHTLRGTTTSKSLFNSPAPAQPVSVTPPAASAAPRTAPVVKVRRLTFEDASPAARKVKQATAATKSGGEGARKLVGPAPSSNGLFNLPTAALELLQAQQEVAAVQQRDASNMHLDEIHALSLVPISFDIVRSIFGDAGPLVKPKDEVLKLLRQKCTFSSGLSPCQAAEQLSHLQRMLPEWIRQEGVQGQHLLQLRTVQQVRISRVVGAGQLRGKLRRAVDAAIADLRQGGAGGGGGISAASASVQRRVGEDAENAPVRATKGRPVGKLLTTGISAPGGGAGTSSALSVDVVGVSDEALALLQ